jgi:redox-sensing transcriptional repressor
MKTLLRLGRYLEIIEKLPPGRVYVSSGELAQLAGVNPSTVRQDFHAFPQLSGVSKRGYTVASLKTNLTEVLGLERETQLVVIGAGRIGQALAGHREFRKINILFRAYFDCNPVLVGQTIDGIPVLHIDQLPDYLARNAAVKIALLAVPAEAADGVMQVIRGSGIRAVWNFAPVILESSDTLLVESEFVGQSLYKLIYNLNQRIKQDEPSEELLVCVGSTCHHRGAEAVTERLQHRLNEFGRAAVPLRGTFCLGHCAQMGVSVSFRGEVAKVTPATVDEWFTREIAPRLAVREKATNPAQE